VRVAKVRIYELAKELGVESKDVIAQAADLGFEAHTASSGVEESDADLIRLAFAEAAGGATDAVAPREVPAAPPAPVPAAPSGSDGAPDAASPSAPEEAPGEEVEIVTVAPGATVAAFAEAVGQPVGAVVKALLTRGTMAAAGQPMPESLMEEIGESFGVMVDVRAAAAAPAAPAARAGAIDDDEASLVPRPPVVTVMGHVDHGKTTLLDTIRKTKVAAGEKGGITQHIGAYQVEVGGNRITFIDTPGHEAFTAMRARGADVTDIVILVVAADDGVMPQTVEAISHSKAAGVQIVVAINKIDLPGADPLRVRTALTEFGIVTEELGGDTPSVEVSAVTGQGVDNLLEVVDLIAQLQEYRANPAAPASGVVIESQLDPGRGPTATVIVKRGTLAEGDSLVAGHAAGRVRAMMDHSGNRLKSAGPSTPVLVMGWADVPTAGDLFEVVESDREARRLADERAAAIRELEAVIPTGRERLQTLLEQLRSEETELRIVLKADTHGSLEALRESVGKITRADGRIDVIHGAVGGITENDVTLADVTGAIVVGFNVRPEGKARKAAEAAGIEVRTYGIIYELLDELEQMLVGKLAPLTEEIVTGSAEVRAVFKVPRAGTIAGCYVTEGTLTRGGRARLLRGGIVIHDGSIGSLRRFKDDVREVATGFECGVGLANYNDVKDGDVIEAYELREVPRT